MHNTQPWKFRILRESQAIEVRADPARMLRHGDPHGRAVHIACGAALLNLRIAVAAGGREPVSRLLPDPAEPLLLAAVRFGGPHRPSEEERDLHTAIPARHTNRRPFSARRVPPQALQRVLLTATLRGIAASPLTQPPETRDAWLVRDPATGRSWPQMILRIGYGLPVPESRRRPVRDVLEAPPRGNYPE